MSTAINYARIVASIYLFFFGALLLAAGLHRFSPELAPGFLAAGAATWIGSLLFILQKPSAYPYARFLRMALFLFWALFTLQTIYHSYYHHPEQEPWWELAFNTLVCLVAGFLFLPLLLVPTRLRD